MLQIPRMYLSGSVGAQRRISHKTEKTLAPEARYTGVKKFANLLFVYCKQVPRLEVKTLLRRIFHLRTITCGVMAPILHFWKNENRGRLFYLLQHLTEALVPQWTGDAYNQLRPPK